MINEGTALWFLFIGYGAVFVILFGFNARAWKRTRDLEEELKLLKREEKS